MLATAKGSGFLAAGSVFDLATRFAVAFLLARLIGADGYGLYHLTITAGAIFAGIACLGLDDAMVRYVARMSRRGDDPGLWGTVQVGLGVAVATSVVVAGGLFVWAQPLAEGLFDEPRLTSLLRLVALLVPFLAISNVLVGCAKGHRRMDYAALGESVVQPLVRVLLLSVLAVVGLDARGAVVVFGVSDVAASVALLVLLNREFAWRRPLRTGVRRDAREIFSFAVPLWLSGLLNQFRNSIETVLLGALSSVTAVGVYAVVGKVTLLGHVAYRAVIVSVKPILAQLHDQRDRAGLSSLYATTTRWTLALNLPFFVIVVLYAEPLLGVFGQRFAAGAAALVVLAVAELVVAATGTCGSVIDMTGHTRVKLVNSVLWLALLVSASALLIPRWGVLGAAVASLVATAVVNVARLLEIWVLERLWPYRREFAKPLVAACAAGGLGWAFRWLGAGEGSLAGMAVGAALVVGTYGGVLVRLGLAAEDRLVLGRVWSRLRGPGAVAVGRRGVRG